MCFAFDSCRDGTVVQDYDSNVFVGAAGAAAGGFGGSILGGLLV
jgi:hypothetical protein